MLNKILVGGGIIAALLSVAIFSGYVKIGGSDDAVLSGEVVIWGTVPEESVNPFLNSYNAKAQSYRFSYKRYEEANFTGALISSIAKGAGPDLIIAPENIIFENVSYLYPYPSASLNEQTYRDAYLDGTGIFWSGGGALALPVGVDPLMLYHNRAMFSKNGLGLPPATWDEVLTTVPILAKKDSIGRLYEYGIALGSDTNIKNELAVAMAIVGQLGQVPVTPQSNGQGGTYYQINMNTPINLDSEVKPLMSTISFLTQFTNPDRSGYSWSRVMTDSQDAFVSEKLGMYIGYASEEGVIRSKNPRIDFGISPLPQTRGYNTFVTGMKLYGIATLRSTKNPSVALKVQSDLAGADWAPSLTQAIGAYPAFRASYNSGQMNESVRRSALVARTWYNISPIKVGEYYTEMIRNVVTGRMQEAEAANTFVNRLQSLFNAQ